MTFKVLRNSKVKNTPSHLWKTKKQKQKQSKNSSAEKLSSGLANTRTASWFKQPCAGSSLFRSIDFRCRLLKIELLVFIIEWKLAMYLKSNAGVFPSATAGFGMGTLNYFGFVLDFFSKMVRDIHVCRHICLEKRWSFPPANRSGVVWDYR